MGETAENLAKQHGIARGARRSSRSPRQRKAAAAQAEGRLADEIVPIRRAAR
jgi:acetyl-CoA acetyltransferase